MIEKRLYALTDSEASELRRLMDQAQDQALTDQDGVTYEDLTYLMILLNTPLDRDAAIERMARVISYLEPGEPWPTNAELGGGPTGTRDDEYRHECMDRASLTLDALLEDDSNECVVGPK